MYEQIKEWGQKVGINPVTKPKIDLDTISKYCKNVREVELEELEDIIAKASSYNIYLKSLKCALVAQISIISSKLNQKIYVETNEMDKFTPKEEKVAIVLSTFKEMRQMQDELDETRMKYLRIKDLPGAIDIAISNMKMVYGRKLNERIKLGSGENVAVNNNS